MWLGYACKSMRQTSMVPSQLLMTFVYVWLERTYARSLSLAKVKYPPLSSEKRDSLVGGYTVHPTSWLLVTVIKQRDMVRLSIFTKRIWWSLIKTHFLVWVKLVNLAFVIWVKLFKAMVAMVQQLCISQLV